MGAENWEQQTLLTTGWAISLALLLISVLVFEINSWSSCLSLPRTVWQMWVTKPCWNTLFSPQPLRVPCLFSGTAQFHQNTYSLTISTMKDNSFKTDNLHAPLLTQCPESSTQLHSWVSAPRPTACLKSQSLERGSNSTRSARLAWATWGPYLKKENAEEKQVLSMYLV